MKIKTLSAAETAFLLRVKLGPLRNYGDFLADCIRDRQNIAGHQLLPIARQQDGKGLRPVYGIEDIQSFISKVLAATPAAGKTAIKTTILNVDTGRHWLLNKFARDGSPVTLH